MNTLTLDQKDVVKIYSILNYELTAHITSEETANAIQRFKDEALKVLSDNQITSIEKQTDIMVNEEQKVLEETARLQSQIIANNLNIALQRNQDRFQTMAQLIEQDF